jgi:chemotaxis protein CheY-P-specific phosphatase CheC
MTVDLTKDEVLLLQDAVAAEIARYLMHGVENEDYESLVSAAQKLGLDL